MRNNFAIMMVIGLVLQGAGCGASPDEGINASSGVSTELHNQLVASDRTKTPPTIETNVLPFYRYYNAGNDDHFYTTNFGELGWGRGGYHVEGIAGYVYPTSSPSTVPFYRYSNAGNGDHFYTTNFGELGWGRGGYRYEGIAGYVYPSPYTGTVPFYRYYNTDNGHHFYTTDFGELGGGRVPWRLEFVAGYIYNQP